jgi:hypothetical protein
MNATGLPSDDLSLPLNAEDLFSTRTRRVEFVLLSLLSLGATITMISLFGTHVNTWFGAVSIAVAGR